LREEGREEGMEGREDGRRRFICMCLCDRHFFQFRIKSRKEEVRMRGGRFNLWFFQSNRGDFIES